MITIEPRDAGCCDHCYRNTDEVPIVHISAGVPVQLCPECLADLRQKLAALPAEQPAPAGVIAWAHYRDGELSGFLRDDPSATRNPRTVHDPGPRSRFVPLVAAEQPAPLPVGAALADPRVQAGACVVEYSGSHALLAALPEPAPVVAEAVERAMGGG